jgi:hypothetical protein
MILGEEGRDVQSPVPECFTDPAFIITVRNGSGLTPGDDEMPEGKAVHLPFSVPEKRADV